MFTHCNRPKVGIKPLKISYVRLSDIISCFLTFYCSDQSLLSFFKFLIFKYSSDICTYVCIYGMYRSKATSQFVLEQTASLDQVTYVLYTSLLSSTQDAIAIHSSSTNSLLKRIKHRFCGA